MRCLFNGYNKLFVTSEAQKCLEDDVMANSFNLNYNQSLSLHFKSSAEKG